MAGEAFFRVPARFPAPLLSLSNTWHQTCFFIPEASMETKCIISKLILADEPIGNIDSDIRLNVLSMNRE